MTDDDRAEIREFRIDVAQSDLEDLQERLARTRWTDEIEGAGWDYGTSLGYLKELTDYWRDGFDWRKQEAKLNRSAQFWAEIGGFRVHFVHERGKGPHPMPILLLHGWPDSFYRFHKIIPMLTDPARFGGDPADSFDVVVPSLPGFGFSDRPRERGWSQERDAALFHTLMTKILGYDRYGAHGNDAGAIVAPIQGRIDPDHVVGVHVNQIFSFPSGDPAEFEGLTQEEFQYLEFLQSFVDRAIHDKAQAAQPQTLAHALADSPAGQLAWSGQLFGPPGQALSADQIVTNASIYWLTNTAASSARFYYENARAEYPTEPTTVPVGLASFVDDFRPIRKFAERDHKNIVSWSEFDRGGHWAAHDAPDLLTGDIRQFFRRLR
jgi:pimeloyl-ACP methyl ester carboxylesterase